MTIKDPGREDQADLLPFCPQSRAACGNELPRSLREMPRLSRHAPINDRVRDGSGGELPAENGAGSPFSEPRP